ncbi:MAG: phosphate ABC transporter permease [Sulfobacillus benefaciens]|uniref:Phosphate ABC transporter permease n=1 Tax=Sulfobacillus benefaciens TaxID=453960 RepID=A0A2T2WZW9_9FIRM|nr:MAG: phosphate ABC transporter permease [Sulfobacillus benefaciens]
MKIDKVMDRVTHTVFALFLVVWLSVAGIIVWGTWRFISHYGFLSPILSSRWNPLAGQFGLWPFILGSLTVTVLAVVIAFPGSLALSVLGSRILQGIWRRYFVRLLMVFVSVPSVLYGWWGLIVIVPWVRRLSGTSGYGMLSASVVLGLMILPTFSILSLEAIRQVPESYVEGSVGLGATEDQTLWRIILPAARPRLVQAALIAVARGLGETIAVQMVIGGQIGGPGLLHPAATLTTQLLTDLPFLPPGVPGHDVLDFMAFDLMVLMTIIVWLQMRIGSWRYE